MIIEFATGVFGMVRIPYWASHIHMALVVLYLGLCYIQKKEYEYTFIKIAE